jgi:hypothetical protein
LLPWRPASLSPSLILRFWATYTRTSWFTPAAARGVVAAEHTHVDDLAALAVRTFRLVSRTSRAFSKIAQQRLLRVSSVSPLGVTLPTRMSPPTSAPMRMMPRSSRSLRMSRTGSGCA